VDFRYLVSLVNVFKIACGHIASTATTNPNLQRIIPEIRILGWKGWKRYNLVGTLSKKIANEETFSINSR